MNHGWPRLKEEACELIPDTEGSLRAPFGARQAAGNRILVVDDELDLWWKPVLMKLAQIGYEVDTSQDGEEAWQALQLQHYDLLITDNKMPKLWGLELIEKLRSARMTLPVILASSALPFEQLARSAHLNIDSTFEKPVTAAKLLDSVERALHPAAAPVAALAF